MASTKTEGFFQTHGVSISVTGLQKAYHTAAGEVQALRALDWSLTPGEAVAIIGPSGCGKTTLLNLLGGVDVASAGTVIVDGQDLTKATERALEDYRLWKVGFVFQFFNLLPTLSALENVELPMMVAGKPERERAARARSLLDMVGLEAKGHQRPEQLSGGEQQRVSVAVALSNDPPLIVADEPTGNLDSKTTEVIARLLVSLATDHGKTIIMASHDPKAVGCFPAVRAMRDGAFERTIENT